MIGVSLPGHSKLRHDQDIVILTAQFIMKKLIFLAGVLLLLLSSQNSSAFDNVLLISVDTLRADHLGCYGARQEATPNMDALARSGVVFNNTVSPAPFTLPSHASLLTGLIPPAHGLHDNAGFYLDAKIRTLAEVFKSQGANTSAFVGALPLDSRFGLDQGFDVYDDSYPTVNSVSGITVPERRAAEVIDAALKWLESMKTQKWFAFVHLYDPHAPYDPPSQFRNRYPDDLYTGEISYVDEQVGRLITFLQQNHLNQKTLIVLTSDHGESLGEHEEKTHGVFAYESTLRIPLIFSPFKTGSVKARVRLIDVAPTILDIQKLPALPNIQGRSLKKMLESPSNVTASPVESYFESLSMHLNSGWAPLRGFYSGNYKFIDLPLSELYDLEKDAREARNLCADAKLCQTWEEKFLTYSRPFLKGTVKPAPVDPETREQMQALGYVSGGTAATKDKYTPEDDPKNLIGIHNRVGEAISDFNSGQTEKALGTLMEIIKEKPAFTEAYIHASYIWNAQGNPEKAVEILRQAKQKGVTSNDLTAKLGLYLYQSGQYEEAIRELNQATRAMPHDLDNLNDLGMAYGASGQYDLAEKTFQKALDEDPTDAMTLSNLGTLFFTQGKLTEAKKYFRQAVEKNSNLIAAWNGLGAISARENDWNTAIQNWKTVLQKNEQNYDVMLNLALAYLKTGRNDEALELLLQFEKNAPEGRYSKALMEVRKLIERLRK